MAFNKGSGWIHYVIFTDYTLLYCTNKTRLINYYKSTDLMKHNAQYTNSMKKDVFEKFKKQNTKYKYREL